MLLTLSMKWSPTLGHTATPREKAAYPLPYLRENKFWINVARVDNGFGDRNLIPAFCACIAPTIEE